MAIKCCGKLPFDTYSPLFCSINDALNDCLAQYPNTPPSNLIFNIVIDSKVYFRRKDGTIGWKENRKKIEGLTEIVEKYRKCKEKNPNITDEDLWDANAACEFGMPKDNPPGPECKDWAQSVKQMFIAIGNAIQAIRTEACDIATGDSGGDTHVQQLLNLPEPEFRIYTVCSTKNGRSRPPEWKPHQFNAVDNPPDIQQGN
jgi:hypothetical protein